MTLYISKFDQFKKVLSRVHFKMLIFDCKEVYVGSANFTGAGIGMKAERTATLRLAY